MSCDNTISNEAFFEFLRANYYANYYQKINLTVEEYENILSFLKKGHWITRDFIIASKEVMSYCLKYSLFCNYEPKMVQLLIDKKDPNIDTLIEKYTSHELIQKIIEPKKGVYGVLLSLYSGDYKRQMQVLSFRDYHLMATCMQLIMPIMPYELLDEDIHKAFSKRCLMSAVPENLKEKVEAYLKYEDYEAIIEMLMNEKSTCKDEDELYSFNTKKIYTFPWEEKVRKVFEDNPCASYFFRDLCEEVDSDKEAEFAQKVLSLF